MTIPEAIKAGRRHCGCENLSFVWYKHIIQSKRPRFNNIFKCVIAESLKPGAGYIPYNITRWRVDCSQCGKLYFANTFKKEMIENLKFIGIPYSRKEN